MSGVAVGHMFVTWDWRDQPDWAAIEIAMSAVFDGTRRPGITPVDDTGCDDYAVVVSSAPLSRVEAQALYNAAHFDGYPATGGAS